MIYSVTKNLGNGDINVQTDSSVSKNFTYDYLVITDHTDSPQYIYAHAKQNELPVPGSFSETGVKLKSINIERWDQNNAKAVPSHNLPRKVNGSYAAWKYQVTYSKQNQESDQQDDDDKHYGRGYVSQYAQNFSASIKQYQQTSYMCYECTQQIAPRVRAYTDKTAFLINVLKQPLAHQNVLKNLTISFDFKISSADRDRWVSKYIPAYVGTVNQTDAVVAQISLKKGTAKITTMSLSSVQGSSTSTIHTQIQITIQKPVALQVYGNLSQTAKPKNQEIPVRIQKWCGTKSRFEIAKSDPNVAWFDQNLGLGHFSRSKRFEAGVDYEIYDKKVVLDKKGQYYEIASEDHPPNLNDPNIGKTYAIISPVVSWKSLKLPKKLK